MRGVAIVAAVLVVVPLVMSAQPRDSVSSVAHREPAALRFRATAFGVVISATVAQALGVPEGWDRTWHGYGNRLSDRVGVALSEELVRVGLERATGWKSVHVPCDSARGARPWRARAGAATRCALRRTFVAQNRAGAARPNMPLLGAIAASRALSLTWRPERTSGSTGPLFLATRVGMVTGTTVVNRAVREMRTKSP